MPLRCCYTSIQSPHSGSSVEMPLTGHGAFSLDQWTPKRHQDYVELKLSRVRGCDTIYKDQWVLRRLQSLKDQRGQRANEADGGLLCASRGSVGSHLIRFLHQNFWPNIQGSWLYALGRPIRFVLASCGFSLLLGYMTSWEVKFRISEKNFLNSFETLAAKIAGSWGTSRRRIRLAKPSPGLVDIFRQRKIGKGVIGSNFSSKLVVVCKLELHKKWAECCRLLRREPL